MSNADDEIPGYLSVEYFRISDVDRSSRPVAIYASPQGEDKLAIIPSSLSFGDVVIGDETLPSSVKITNTGTAVVTIKEISITGPFKFITDAPDQLNPAQTALLQVSFAPRRAGDVTGAVYIDTGDAAGQEVIELKGFGRRGTSTENPGEGTVVVFATEEEALAGIRKDVVISPFTAKKLVENIIGDSGGTTPNPGQIAISDVAGLSNALQARELTENRGKIYPTFNVNGKLDSSVLPNGTTANAGIVALTSDFSKSSSALALTQEAGFQIARLSEGKANKATTLAGYGIGDAYTKAQTNAAIDAAVLAGGSGGSGNSDTPNEILEKLKTVDGSSSGLDADLLDGHDATFFAAASDLAEKEVKSAKNQANGYAGLGADGKLLGSLLPATSGASDAKDVTYYPRPTIAVPLHQRLGQEVFITDGYIEGSNLTDFSDLIATNLARAVSDKRPLIIPHGLFKAKRQFIAENTGIVISGYGKMQSGIQWATDAVSSGFRIIASDNKVKPDFVHFRDMALFTEQKNAGEAIYASFEKQIVQNNGNPVIVDRFSTRFRAQDVAIRGAEGATKDGWNKGITCMYEIDAILRDVQFEGPIDGYEPKYMADWAFYIGAGAGYGHPTGPFVDTCNVFHAKKAVVFEGNEGGVVTNSQLVGVIVGVDFIDDSGRPLLMCTNNHINAFGACIRADAASQIQIIGNSLYHTVGADRDGTGVSIAGSKARSQHAIITNNVFESCFASDKIFTGIVIYGCDHGVIDHNTFRTGVVSPTASNMNGIVLSSNARFFKVGANNVFEDPRSGRPALLTTIANGGVDNVIAGGAGGGGGDAANVTYFPTPEIAVPVAQRLGMEIALTDGYVLGSALTDFSDLMEKNLALSMATGRPLIIPADEFFVKKAFKGANKSVSMFGFGMSKSILTWATDSASVGLSFSFNHENQQVTMEDFGLQTQIKNLGTAIKLDWKDIVVDNNGNPVVIGRFFQKAHISRLLIGGRGGTPNNGFANGIDCNIANGVNIVGCSLLGGITGADPNYTAGTAIRLGAPDPTGYGHPTIAKVRSNYFQHWQAGIIFEGMEGCYAHDNDIVGAKIGIWFKDAYGRPQFNVHDNHINCSQIGIWAQGSGELNIKGNLIYGVIGNNTTATGILVNGQNSVGGIILGNQFANTASNGSGMNSIIIEAGRDITIDNNVFRRNSTDPINGIWLAGGSKRCIVGPGNIFENETFGTVGYRVNDGGTNNMMPGRGARFIKNQQQGLNPNGLNIVYYETYENMIGNLNDDMTDGAFVVPADGTYCFTAGVLFSDGGTSVCTVNIQKNAVQGNPIVNNSSYWPQGNNPAFLVTTGAIACKQNDVFRVGANPGNSSRTVLNHPATFFEVRRLN